jgi:hypothetical protein
MTGRSEKSKLSDHSFTAGPDTLKSHVNAHSTTT